MGIVLTVLFVALLWTAAVAFGTDSRDGRDGFARGGPGERSSRQGD